MLSFATNAIGLRHVCKDGREVIVDSRMQLFGDDTVLEVNRDVTDVKALTAERQRFETALHESEQGLSWLASIVESSDDAIVSKNLDGIITSWNRGAERIFGYTAGEAVGRPITIVIPLCTCASWVHISPSLQNEMRMPRYPDCDRASDCTSLAEK